MVKVKGHKTFRRFKGFVNPNKDFDPYRAVVGSAISIVPLLTSPSLEMEINETDPPPAHIKENVQ